MRHGKPYLPALVVDPLHEGAILYGVVAQVKDSVGTLFDTLNL